MFTSFNSEKFILEALFIRNHLKLQYSSTEKCLTVCRESYNVFYYCFQMSEEGRGVACISDMLTITRFHNSISASSVIRR